MRRPQVTPAGTSYAPRGCQAIFCNWFNEYITFSERDQIAIAYVLLRMGLTAENGKTAPELNLLPRSMHYLQSAAARELELVKKVGHRSGSRKAVARQAK